MTAWADPVAVIRATAARATGAPTTTVLDAAFTAGPMPLIHVHLLSTDTGDIDRVDQVGVDVYAVTPTGPGVEGAAALADRLAEAWWDVSPVAGGGGFVDGVDVSQRLGVRPYFEDIEIVSMVLDVTHRPTD